MLTKREALEQLEACDHGLLSAEGVRALTEPFGFQGSVRTFRADPPGTFKGLSLAGGMQETLGMAADETGWEIARHLGLSPMAMHGRGSRLRSACTAIRRHLDELER